MIRITNTFEQQGSLFAFLFTHFSNFKSNIKGSQSFVSLTKTKLNKTETFSTNNEAKKRRTQK